jgi:hypothetical protein
VGTLGTTLRGGGGDFFCFGAVKRGNWKLCGRTFLEVSSDTESIK